jgi:cation/acetate symporter
VLGITGKGQNVAYMVSRAFAIAASGNFPALLMSIFWRRFTTAGAVSSMLFGTLATLLLIYLSPTIQVDILHRTTAWFPLKNPALLTIPLSFLVGVVVSLLGARASVDDRALDRRMHLGEVSG